MINGKLIKDGNWASEKKKKKIIWQQRVLLWQMIGFGLMYKYMQCAADRSMRYFYEEYVKVLELWCDTCTEDSGIAWYWYAIFIKRCMEDKKKAAEDISSHIDDRDRDNNNINIISGNGWQSDLNLYENDTLVKSYIVPIDRTMYTVHNISLINIRPPSLTKLL